MIRVALLTGQVTVALTGGLAGASLTVKRLSSPDFARCQQAALALIRDPKALTIILTRHGLAETAGDLKRAMTDMAFQAGYGAWLASVECGLAGILDWEGVVLEDGSKAPLAGSRLPHIAGTADPAEPADLAVRMTMETLMLDQAFEAQASGAISRAARLLATEGNGSGLSVNGSGVAPPKTPGGPRGARTAKRPRRAARKAGGTGQDDTAPS